MHLLDTIHRPEAQHFWLIFPDGITFCFFLHKKGSVAPMGGRISPKVGVGASLIRGNIWPILGHFVLGPFLPSCPATAFDASTRLTGPDHTWSKVDLPVEMLAMLGLSKYALSKAISSGYFFARWIYRVVGCPCVQESVIKADGTVEVAMGKIECVTVAL